MRAATLVLLAATLLVALPALAVPEAAALPPSVPCPSGQGEIPGTDPVHCLGLCYVHDDGTIDCRQ